MTSFLGKNVLITGASAGMGVDYAWEFAAEGANLILVARRVDRLEALKAELVSRHPALKVRVLPCDLGDAAARDALYTTLKDEGTPVDALINNAGLGLHGPFLESDWNGLQNMIAVDVSAVTHLTHLFGNDMKARGSGHILLVASVVGHFSVPGYAVYSASKYYVRALGTALNDEFKSHGVHVTTVSPGATATEFFDVAEHKPSLLIRTLTGTSLEVVRAALNGLRKGKREVIPGILNWMVALQARLMPTALMTLISARMFR